MDGARLLVVDGHAYAYRAFHAIRSLKAPDGVPSNGLFGFIKAVERLRLAVDATHGAVIWDGGLAAERVAICPGYKAQRPPMPQALADQIDPMQAWLGAWGMRSICQEGVEADDLIGSLATRASGEGARVFIASSDKDFMQLVSDTVAMVNPNDPEPVPWDDARVVGKTGVHPAQIVDWLSLIGDSVDNIPGVPGVGTKTATALLTQFGSWEAIRQNSSAIESARIRAAVESSTELVARNIEMIRLRCDLEGCGSLNDCAYSEPDRAALAVFYRRWGFRSLLAGVEDAKVKAEMQPDLFAVAAN